MITPHTNLLDQLKDNGAGHSFSLGQSRLENHRVGLDICNTWKNGGSRLYSRV